MCLPTPTPNLERIPETSNPRRGNPRACLLPCTPPSPSPPSTSCRGSPCACPHAPSRVDFSVHPPTPQRKCAKNSDIIVPDQNANRHYQERITSTQPCLPLAGTLKAGEEPARLSNAHNPSAQHPTRQRVRSQAQEPATKITAPPDDRRESEDCERVVVRLTRPGIDTINERTDAKA